MTKTRLSLEDERTGDRQSTSEPRSVTSCTECGGHIVRDDERGETSCEDCGLVHDEDAIDHGPEWRAFFGEERDKKRRVGPSSTHLLHDNGLSTIISRRNKDASGKAVPPRKRARLHRLRTWDERYRTKDGRERNLKQGFGEINRMASALDLPEPVRETAGILYRQAVEGDLLPGRSIEGMSTAALYVASRQHGSPRTSTSFADVSRVEKIRIQRAYRYLSRELGLEIEPAVPAQHVPHFASTLGVSSETERMARELLDVAMANNAHSGKSPAGLAAAALYAASHLTNDQLTQETTSNVAGVSRITIRDRYQELLEVYGNQT